MTSTAIVILIVLLAFFAGVIVGVLLSACYYYKVIKIVNKELAGGPYEDEEYRERVNDEDPTIDFYQ